MRSRNGSQIRTHLQSAEPAGMFVRPRSVTTIPQRLASSLLGIYLEKSLCVSVFIVGLRFHRFISVFRSSLNTRLGVRRQRARNEPGDAAFCERGARERIQRDPLSLRLFSASRSARCQSGVAGSCLASATALQVSNLYNPSEERRQRLCSPLVDSE